MPYVRDGMTIYTEQELGGMGGWLDKLKSAGGQAFDWMKTGAAQQLQPQQPTGPTTPYQPPSFMDKYGTLLILGGAGLVLFLILKKKKGV